MEIQAMVKEEVENQLGKNNVMLLEIKENRHEV